MKLTFKRLLPLILYSFYKFSILTGQAPELVLPIGHSAAIRNASYSPDGKRIATVSEDRTVKIWNAETGRLMLTIDEFTDLNRVSSVTFSPDGKTIMTISEDYSVATQGKVQMQPSFPRCQPVSSVHQDPVSLQ